MNADRWVLIVSMLFFFPVAAECQTAEIYFIDDAGQPTAVVLESGRATVRVVDPSSNYSSAYADSISVIISVALTGDYEYPTLYETGPDTGVFEGSIDLALSAVADEFNELLETTESAGPPHAFDTLTASHLGPGGEVTAVATTLGSRTSFIDAYGAATGSFAEGSAAYVRVEDHNRDQPGIWNSVQVDLQAPASGDTESLMLAETAKSSGIFEGWIALGPASSALPQDGVLQESAGEVISANHLDLLAFTSSSTTAQVTFGQLEFIEADGLPAEDVLENGSARVRLASHGDNLDPVAVELVSIDLESLHAGDSETVQVTETGVDTGVFEGAIDLASAPAAAFNGLLETADGGPPDYPGEQITASYGSDNAVTTVAGSRVTFIDVYGREETTYAVSEQVIVRVTDPSRNDPQTLDSQNVTVTVPATGDAETIQLDETAPDSGVFEGGVASGTGGGGQSPQDGVLWADPGDLAEVEHSNPAGTGTRRAEATIVASKTLFIDAAGQPVGAVLESSRAYVRVIDVASNFSPSSADSTSVTFWTELTGDYETPYIYETGPDTGIFEGSIDLALSPVADEFNDLLETFESPGPPHEFDLLTAEHLGPSGPSSATAATIGSRTRWIDAAGEAVSSFDEGSTAYLRVEDHNLDQPGQLDFATIDLHSLATGDAEGLSLAETGPSTGVFEGSIALGPAPGTPQDGVLQTAAGEVLEAVHRDALAYTESLAQATVDAVTPSEVLLAARSSVDPWPGDAAVKSRLESLGYAVILRGQAELDAADAAGKALVVISSTLQSAAVGATFRDVAVPVLLWEAFILDDMKMTGPVAQVDYGSIVNQQEVAITTTGHPLAAGLAGPRQVTAAGKRLIWGRPAASAEVVGTAVADAERAAIFAYEAGDVMAGMTAPARRVGFFLYDDSATVLTADGWTLFDAAVCWAVNCTSAPIARFTASPEAGPLPLAVSFDASASESAGAPISTYAWDFGDGAAGSGVSTGHDYTVAGGFTVALTVTDSQGRSDTATATIDAGTPPEALLVAAQTALDPADGAVKNRLEGLGYVVEVLSQGAAQSSDAAGKAIVVVSSTVQSSQVGSKFRDVAVPFVTWEAWLYDDMKMTGTGKNVNYGRITDQDYLDVTGPGHPLAAGLSGLVSIVPGTTVLRWGVPGAAAEVAAVAEGDPGKALIFGYRAGMPMVGLTAPARRVGLPFADDSAAILNADGWALFDAAVAWAVEAP